MPPGYTCRRCLRSLKTLPSSRSSVHAPTAGPRRRWNSSKARPVLQDAVHPQSSIQARQQSTTGTQGQIPKYEPPMTPTPPGLADTLPSPVSGNVLLQPNNLFHSFSDSPSPEIRRRAAFMKTHAYCPHPSHRRTRVPLSPNDPESKKSPEKSAQPPAFVRFECPDCGIPVSCSEQHWMEDYESHMEICDTLREANEDDHDLRSGRFHPEFEYPGPQMVEALVNMTNWDTYLYTREFGAVNDERHLRQVTRLLTYPVTIGSILSELSPYDIRDGRITTEGLKSLSGTFTISPPSPSRVFSCQTNYPY